MEIGLLVDIVHRLGLAGTAQVDLGVREHRNRPIDDLGPQATAILVTALRRAGLTRPGDLDRDHATLTRFTEAFEARFVDVEVHERPAIGRCRPIAPSSISTRDEREVTAPEGRGHSS